MTNNPKIFTFWEPKQNIPVYIQLCMQTWKKFLPEYEIIVVDYSNIDKYLGKKFYDKILYKDFPLMLQTDAIRCALLKLHGGIWIDADTIITSSEAKNYLKLSYEFILIGKHIGFIKADKNCALLNSWLKQIKFRLNFYKKNKNYLLYIIGKIIKKAQKFNFPGSNILFRNKLIYKIKNFLKLETFLRMKRWDFFGYDILKQKKFFSIDRIKINALPEIIGKKEINNLEENYIDFYFRNDYSKDVLNNTKGIILLHNSRTPKKYQKMNKEEFLNQNNTLSNILKTILKEKTQE